MLKKQVRFGKRWLVFIYFYPGAAANRVASEACVQARNEGRDLSREGGDVIREACKWSPELSAACEVWKEIKFEFETIDKL